MLRVADDDERLRDVLDEVTLPLDEELVLREDTALPRDVPADVPTVPLPDVTCPLPTEFCDAAAFDVPRDDCP